MRSAEAQLWPKTRAEALKNDRFQKSPKITIKNSIWSKTSAWGVFLPFIEGFFD